MDNTFVKIIKIIKKELKYIKPCFQMKTSLEKEAV